MIWLGAGAAILLAVLAALFVPQPTVPDPQSPLFAHREPSEQIARPVPGNIHRWHDSLAAFLDDFDDSKTKILELEQQYLSLIAPPKEDARSVQEKQVLLETTHGQVAALEEELRRQFTAQDGNNDEARKYCDGEAANAAIDQCIELADMLQRYEAGLSTFEGMMEVMKRRYDEAKAAVQGQG